MTMLSPLLVSNAARPVVTKRRWPRRFGEANSKLSCLSCWCREGGSNPHDRKGRRILSPLRLPVPPSRPGEYCVALRAERVYLLPASLGATSGSFRVSHSARLLSAERISGARAGGDVSDWLDATPCSRRRLPCAQCSRLYTGWACVWPPTAEDDGWRRSSADLHAG
jgi:hypothetical protein